MKHTLIALATGLLFCAGAQAQTVAGETARNAEQQQRIENGLQSGQLSTREAANIERQEQRVDRTESRGLRDGTLSAADKAQIQREQNQVSRDIFHQKHDAQTGDPTSASSRRVQADVQRNANQQARIHQGVRSGGLTHREVGALEHGQARVERKEANAGADGHVGASGQVRIQHAQNRQSARVFRKKHNDRERAGA